MATFSILFREPNASGEKKIYIRVCHQGTKTTIPTDYRATEADICNGQLRSTSPLKVEIDADLLTAQQTIKELGARVRAYTIKDVASLVKVAIQKSHCLATRTADFFEFGYDLAQRKNNKSTGDSYRFVLNAVAKFYGDVLPFSAITKRWLLGFEAHLRRNGVSQTTISTYMRRLRTIIRQAMVELNDEEVGDIVVPYDPFKSYRIPPEITTTERHMSLEDVRRIFNYRPDGIREELAKDVFLLSLSLLGINAIDLYNAPAISQGRITYRRSKIADRRGAAATLSVAIIPEIEKLSAKYASTDYRYAFNFRNLYASVGNFRHAVNTGLASICNRLGIPTVTFYYARHAFAETAHQALGYSLEDVAKCLNHSSQTRSVTFRYAGKNYALIDEIQREVVRHITEGERPRQCSLRLAEKYSQTLVESPQSLSLNHTATASSMM
jgi:integrase